MYKVLALIKENKIIVFLILAAVAIYTYWVYKIRGAVKKGIETGGKAAGSIVGAALAPSVPIMASVAGFVSGIFGNNSKQTTTKSAEVKAAETAQIKKENAVKTAAALVPDATQAQNDRANTLLKGFSGTGNRVRFINAVNCSEITVDIFGAVKELGTKKLYSAKVYERASVFLKQKTKTGYLIFLDSYTKKFYSVNPHSITLV